MVQHVFDAAVSLTDIPPILVIGKGGNGVKALFGSRAQYVVQDERFMRPAEVDLLVGDPSKAGEILGWEPTVTFGDLVRLMVEADIEALKRNARVPHLDYA